MSARASLRKGLSLTLALALGPSGPVKAVMPSRVPVRAPAPRPPIALGAATPRAESMLRTGIAPVFRAAAPLAPAAQGRALAPILSAFSALGQEPPAQGDADKDQQRLDGSFDNREQQPARPALAVLPRGESLGASITATAHLLALRSRHNLPSLSRQNTADAINALRGFRLALGYGEAQPAIRMRLRGSSGSSSRTTARIAAQIRGIERHALLADGDLEQPDERQKHVLGVVLRGREPIEAFEKELAATRRTLREPLSITGVRMVTGAIRLILGLAVYGAIKYVAEGDPLFSILSGVFLAVETAPVLLRHLRAALPPHLGAGRVERFLVGAEAWAYDSRSYSLVAPLVNQSLRHGVPAALGMPLVIQNIASTLGILTRHGVGYQRMPRDAWLSIDRLLFRDEDDGPVMILAARASMERPRFPKPARDPAWKEALSRLLEPARAPLPAPMPVPVTVPGRRR